MKVLVVDDDPTIRAIARMSLGRVGGMTVVEASRGAEALALAASELPDVIVLDVMMPEMDGPQTLAALRENAVTAGIPVVFLTARSSAGDSDELLALGAVGVLTKPFNPASLAQELRDVLAAQR